MQLSNRIFLGLNEDKDLSFTQFINNSRKKFSKKSSFSNYKGRKNLVGDFGDYQKEQYKKFFVSRKDYIESLNASEIFKFRKVDHILFLVFCTYFFGLRLISNYDWFYWRYLVNAFHLSNVSNIKKYFQYRSLFTNIDSRVNMVQLSLFIFIFKSFKNISDINLFFFIEKLFIQFYLYRYVSVLWFILDYKASFLISKLNIIPQYFLINNNNINAIFLSRYIAKMLDYNNTLRSILNPLKKEFKAVVKGTK